MSPNIMAFRPERYHYLGTTIDSKLKFEANTEDILKKCHQRQYFLRKLNSFGVNKSILKAFYFCYIESVLAFSLCAWFSSLSLQNRNSLQRIVNVCSKIIGQPLRPLSSVCQQQTKRAAIRIIRDPSHCLFPAFVWLPSGQRLCCPRCRTQRRRATFVPEAVRILNCDCSRGGMNITRS